MLVWCSNHLLNLCCGLADLGCISAVLWGFEDREIVFDSLEAVYGARLHVASDLLSMAVLPSAVGNEVLELLVGRMSWLGDVFLLRLVGERLLGVCGYTYGLSVGRSLSGVHGQAAGLAVDGRTECSVYSRAAIATIVGGAMGCSLARMQARLSG